MALQPLAGLGVRAVPRQQPAYQQPQPDESNLLESIGTPILTGVGAVANLLDTPGSVVRDIVGGIGTGNWSKYNPFDQLLSPFGSQNRVYGRDVLSDLGVLNTNKETGISGWFSDPMEAVRDLAGFAFDVGTDPFVFATGPTNAALGATARTAGKIGGRFVPQGIKSAAKSAGSQAKLLGNRLFDASVKGRATPAGQSAARELTSAQKAVDRSVLGETLPIARKLEQQGLIDEPSALAQRNMLEGVTPMNDPTGGLARIKDLQRQAQQTAESLGLPSDQLDDVIDYSARRMGSEVSDLFQDAKLSGKGARPLGTVDPADVGRQQVYKGFKGGTNQVNEVLTDPEWNQIISQAGTKRQAVDAVANRLAAKHGPTIRPLFVTKKGKVIDRYYALAKKIVENPELRERGLFTNHWLADAQEALISKGHQAEAAKTMYKVLGDQALHQGPRPVINRIGERPTTIGDILKKLKIKSDIGAENVAREMGVALSADDAVRRLQLKSIRNTVIDKNVADDVVGLWPGWKAPEEVGTLAKFMDSATNTFKAGVLTWPARYVRDIVSGAARNWEQGMFSIKDGINAHQLLQGRAVDGLTNIPVVRDWLARTGRPLTDEAASDAVREMYASYKATKAFQNTDLPNVQPGLGGIDSLLEQVPGRTPALSARELGSTFTGRAQGATLNPLDLRGVYKRSGEIRRETGFGPAKAGDIVGKYSDDVNRLSPFLNQLRKGVDPAKAMDKIMRAQVDYSPQTFTKTEQALKRIFPFYSFSSRQFPYIAKELASNPGGRLGQVLRAQNEATGNSNAAVPEYLQETFSVPLGESPDGGNRYLAGLGLMHEDPLSFFGGGLRGTLEEAGSRLNPLPKAAIEYGMNRSLFRRGQALDELDPTVGRILSNVGLTDEDASGRAKPLLGSPLLEHTLANSPLSRLLSTVRTATDPRKYSGEAGPLPLFTNLLTGARITDVSPAQEEGIIRDMANEIAKRDLGARTYETAYVPKELIAEAENSGDFKTAERMKAYNRLLRLLASKAKSRKKEKAK